MRFIQVQRIKTFALGRVVGIPDNWLARQRARTGRGTHPDGLKVKALVPVGLSANRKLAKSLIKETSNFRIARHPGAMRSLRLAFYPTLNPYFEAWVCRSFHFAVVLERDGPAPLPACTAPNSLPAF
jgi:hypothetical protein